MRWLAIALSLVALGCAEGALHAWATYEHPAFVPSRSGPDGLMRSDEYPMPSCRPRR